MSVEMLQKGLENDPVFHQAFKQIDPLLLIEAAEELAAGARCINALHKKLVDAKPDDLLILQYVVGSIRRTVSRTLGHLDEANIGKVYHNN